MLVRQFGQPGIEAFRAFLASCREDPETAIPNDLLYDDALSSAVRPPLTVEPRNFNERADAAEYLGEVLSPLPEYDVANNAGLWSWLTLFYFDEVCPVRDGKRRVKNDYYYIFDPKNSRHVYRHLLFIAWRVRCIAPDHNRLFLRTPVSSLDKVTTEVMKRLYLTRIPCIFEVLDRLYWDDKRRRARVGIVQSNTVRPGDLSHRFPIRIQQLEKTYDLHSLDADQMIELLGEEFQGLGDSNLTFWQT